MSLSQRAENGGPEFPRLRRFNTAPSPVTIELVTVVAIPSPTSTRKWAFKANQKITLEPSPTSPTAMSRCASDMPDEASAISNNGGDTDRTTSTDGDISKDADDGNGDNSDNRVSNHPHLSPAPSPSPSPSPLASLASDTASLTGANQVTDSSNRSPRSILKSLFQTFLTPMNLAMTFLAVAALVWGIKSYNAANFGNLLNQMEACRQHPNDTFLQSTDLCIKMRQQHDYDSDISLPITDVSATHEIEAPSLPNSANGHGHQRRNVEQDERP
ncbi:hypothetical protein EDB81DRAFT_939537, partial [Dactylonectria macrodidyma]